MIEILPVFAVLSFYASTNGKLLVTLVVKDNLIDFLLELTERMTFVHNLKTSQFLGFFTEFNLNLSISISCEYIQLGKYILPFQSWGLLTCTFH